MKRYEYLLEWIHLDGESTAYLDHLGSNGWQLVQVLGRDPGEHGFGPDGDPPVAPSFHGLFMREVE